MLEPQNPQNHADRVGEPRPGADEARLTDREVPLPGTEALGSTPAAVHAWLDGEGTEADALQADAAQVALWNRIGEETMVRRRMTTPADLQSRIMDALPAAAPSAAMAAGAVSATAATTATRTASAAPAADGRIALSPFAAAVSATGLIALGFLLARMLG